MIQGDNLGATSSGLPDDGRVVLTDLLDWDRPRLYRRVDVEAAADACARGLLRRGLRRGEAVGILSANRAEFVLAMLGIMRAGLVAVPVNPKLPRETIEYIFADASVRHVFCDGARRMLVPPALGPTDYDATDASGFDALLDPGAFDAVHPAAGETAMVLYTSGSTGIPKGVPLSHDGQLWALRARCARGWPFDAHRLLVAAPLYHMNGLCTSLFAVCAASLVLMPGFDARQYLQAIERFRCTWLTGVPPMLAMCLRETDLLASPAYADVATVRMGSAPITPSLWQDVQALFPNASLLNGYGTTEAGPIVCGPRPDRAMPALSIGWPVKGVELRLVDAEGRDADEGVLWQRTPSMMAGYLNLPEKTRQVLTPEGWYISGDIFRRDADGAYYFIGRADDMFVCGGENIYPGEVESLLERHAEIKQACVVPVPDDIKGEKPVAFVVRTAGSTLSEDAVKQHALAHGPAYLHPRQVHFLDTLPLAGPNKVDRKGLRQRALELRPAGGA
jgi:acyl-CoA synthetase (AMP-forming)/AMP-acid ligase II